MYGGPDDSVALLLLLSLFPDDELVDPELRVPRRDDADVDVPPAEERVPRRDDVALEPEPAWLRVLRRREDEDDMRRAAWTLVVLTSTEGRRAKTQRLMKLSFPQNKKWATLLSMST